MHVIGDTHLLTQMALSLEGIGDAVAISTSDNVISYVNAAFVEMYGYTKAEITGRHASVIIPPDQCPLLFLAPSCR